MPNHCNTCGPSTLLAPPAPASSGLCYTNLDGECIILELAQGGTFSYTIFLPDARKCGAYVTSYTPGSGGNASIQLSSPNHKFEVGDCIYVFGVCPGSPGYCEFGGFYTIAGFLGDTLQIVEAIVGTVGEPVTWANNRIAPLVYAATDLTNATLEMSLYSRGACETQYGGVKASTVVGSNQIRVFPRGRVCLYDRVTIPDAGIGNAQVREVYAGAGYDVIEVFDQVADQTTTSVDLVGTTGKITDFMVDMTNAACGQVTFYLNPEDTELNGVSYLGTSTIKPVTCTTAVKKSCLDSFDLGQFSISVSATDPISNRLVKTYIQHGDITGRLRGFNCN